MIRWKMLPLAITLFLAGILGFTGAADAAPQYEVTVTNLTRGVVFTPPLVAIHKKGVSLFKAGDPASGDLELVAEMGDTSNLQSTLDANPKVGATATTAGGPFGPGTSASATVEASHGFNRISLVGMLLPTNDGFFAINGAKLPFFKKNPVVLYSPGYDAGTEINDELCGSIPGPDDICRGAGGGPRGSDEGFVVHIHSGIQGVGEIDKNARGWRNPVAKITIRRVK